MSNTETLFTPEQQDKLMDTVKEIMQSKFVDPSNPPTPEQRRKAMVEGRGKIPDYYKPGSFDLSNPEVWFREVWQSYMTYLSIHDRPSNKKGTRRFNTTKKRSVPAKNLAKYLGRTPTTADLKAAYPSLTKLDDDICIVIDRDLESLVRG
jgi:hypothetical protein